jgi:hypothetical protein
MPVSSSFQNPFFGTRDPCEPGILGWLMFLLLGCFPVKLIVLKELLVAPNPGAFKSEMDHFVCVLNLLCNLPDYVVREGYFGETENACNKMSPCCLW